MTNDKLIQVAHNLKCNWKDPHAIENMDKSEKVVSVGAGAFIFLKGISNIISNPILAVAEVAIGGGLIYRGITGYCPVKELLEKEDPSIYVRETFIHDNSTPPLGI